MQNFLEMDDNVYHGSLVGATGLASSEKAQARPLACYQCSWRQDNKRIMLTHLRQREGRRSPLSPLEGLLLTASDLASYLPLVIAIRGRAWIRLNIYPLSGFHPRAAG